MLLPSGVKIACLPVHAWHVTYRLAYICYVRVGGCVGVCVRVCIICRPIFI